MSDASRARFLCARPVKMIVSLEGPGAGPVMNRHPSLGILSLKSKDYFKVK